jgi:hypothetical protein
VGMLRETHVYSAGGVARGYAGSIRLSPPIVPEDRLGPSSAAFFGGWAGIRVRGRVPVIHVDVRREYQTVFLLQQLQDLLFAERLHFVDDTETVRKFVENITLDDCFDPDVYPQLNVLCWVKPAGEMLVGRWAFQMNARGTPEHWRLFVAPRSSDGAVVLCLADVVAAKILCGRAPEIIRAERIVTEGRQRLRKARILGATFDPAKDQLFKVLVEEGERLNQGLGWYAKIPEPIRKALVPGVKGIGNIGCFGMLMEARQMDRREGVMLFTADGPLRRTLAHPEGPGPFACPPLAALVTAGGRLLLALVHRLVADRGGIVAAWDTDGAYIVATPGGGTVNVETRGANFYESGPAEPVRALSAVEVAEIAARFEPLNPFDRELLPGSPLRLKGQSDGLFPAIKRYSLSGPDGHFVDFKESILGMLTPPSDGWMEDAWRTLNEMWDARRLTKRPWFDLPAVRTLSLSSPAYAEEYKALSGMRPWTQFLAAIVVGHHPNKPGARTATVIAPYEPDPAKWSGLPWRFAESGELVTFGVPDQAGVRWRLRTLVQFLTSYIQHPIAEMLAPDGSPCGPHGHVRQVGVNRGRV